MSDEDNILPLPFSRDATDEERPALLDTSEFAYIGQGLSAAAFDVYVQSYDFGTIPPDYLVLHHTAIPDASWAPYTGDPGTWWDRNEAGLSNIAVYGKRRRQLDGIMRYYRDSLGWSAGPHLFVDDRWIWLFTPMADIGIHAREGNSYHDSAGHLHYSLGIEVIGYYEHVHWPAAIQRNISLAVHSLKRRLGTFEIIYHPAPLHQPGAHAGSVCSHRDFNKPACPGAAITEDFYISVLRDHPDPVPVTMYRVRSTVTAGATIRAGPSTKMAILGRLHIGDMWSGSEVQGDRVTLAPFGSSRTWIKAPDGRCVWSGLLEEAP